MKVTGVFEKNFETYKRPDVRFIVNEGGTGSSKTYSICQLFIVLAHTMKSKILTICRKTMPALRATAMRDFFNILKAEELYDERYHNKSDNIYWVPQTGSMVEFLAIADEMRIRSRQRDLLYINEANELSYEEFEQLNMRTNEKVFLDYNPSFWRHWIYSRVTIRPNAIVIRSTYKDNPFLAEERIREIESFRETDDVLWQVYGLGERAVPQYLIYPEHSVFTEAPEGLAVYGLDFGYVNPTALVEVKKVENNLYVREVLYESYLHNADLIERLKRLVDRRAVIMADPSEPAYISEIRMAGFDIRPAKIRVLEGINLIKRFRLFVSGDNLEREISTYQWRRMKEGTLVEEPVKMNDHLMDAMRYAVSGLNLGESPRLIKIRRSSITDGMLI